MRVPAGCSDTLNGVRASRSVISLSTAFRGDKLDDVMLAKTLGKCGRGELSGGEMYQEKCKKCKSVATFCALGGQRYSFVHNPLLNSHKRSLGQVRAQSRFTRPFLSF